MVGFKRLMRKAHERVPDAHQRPNQAVHDPEKRGRELVPQGGESQTQPLPSRHDQTVGCGSAGILRGLVIRQSAANDPHGGEAPDNPRGAGEKD